MNERQRRQLATLVATAIEWSCPLSRHTSLAIGGPAEALLRVGTLGELQGLLRFFGEEGIPWQVIGKGTNLLVADAGVAGAVLRLHGELAAIGEPHLVGETARVTVGAGAGLARLCREAGERGLTGLEFACGIPGTVGGAVCMNAGAWGGEIGPLVKRIRLVAADGVEDLAPGLQDFSYRRWEGWEKNRGRAVLAEVDLLFGRGEPSAIASRMRELGDRRKASQPRDYANAGSFFKNPPGDSAGRLIEACGLKGQRLGGAMISPVHANFLVNTGAATAADVLRLMRMVQDRVRQETGIALLPEVQFLGDLTCG